MTPKFTRGGYHRNGGTLLAADLRRELGIHMEEIAVRT